MEYRGYDSAGIAVLTDKGLQVRKKKGKIENLEKLLMEESLTGTTGIGHTRWATHGSPSDVNAHPHLSMDGKIAVVHNGIVENYVELREDLAKNHGIKFITETDTEVIAQLISVKYPSS